MDNKERALQYFSEGYNCSQSVFAAMAEQKGISKEMVLRIASGFGGGMGRLQKTCGAVTGAIMAIGLLEGYSHPEDAVKKEKSYSLSREFIEQFTHRHGTVECSALLGCSLVTEEGKARIKELNLSEEVCATCVKDAVILLEELLV